MKPDPVFQPARRQAFLAEQLVGFDAVADASFLQGRKPMFSGLLLALAVNVFPVFDIEKACRMDTEAAQEDNGAYQACVKDEEAAKTKISAQWSQYPNSSRMTCSSEQTDEFDESYVELMTCLEMQDWKTHLDDISGGAATGESAARSGALGGSPLTPSQIGGYSATHPLGGVPGAHFR